VVVGCPNRFFRGWLSRRYAALVADVAGDVLGRAVAVEFRVTPELFRAFRAEQHIEGAAHGEAGAGGFAPSRLSAGPVSSGRRVTPGGLGEGANGASDRAGDGVGGAAPSAPAETVPDFLREIRWDARFVEEEERLYAHGDRLLHEAIRQFRVAERDGPAMRRPSSYFVGIVRRLARQRDRAARRPAGVSDRADQLHFPPKGGF